MSDTILDELEDRWQLLNYAGNLDRSQFAFIIGPAVKVRVYREFERTVCTLIDLMDEPGPRYAIARARGIWVLSSDALQDDRVDLLTLDEALETIDQMVVYTWKDERRDDAT